MWMSPLWMTDSEAEHHDDQMVTTLFEIQGIQRSFGGHGRLTW